MKKILKVQIIILIIIILTTYTNFSFATTKSELQNEQSSLNSAINEANQELKETQSEKSETLSQVENLMSQISDYQDEIDDLNTQIKSLESQISDAEKQIKEDEEKYNELKEKLNERLVAMYENGDVSYLDVILSSKSIIDAISSYYLVSELASYDNEMMNQVEEEKEKIENEKNELVSNKESLDSAKNSKEAKANALKVAKKEKEEKVSQLSAEEKKQQEEIQEMLDDKAKIDSQIQAIIKKEAEEAAKKAAAEAAAKKSSSSSTSSTTTVTPSKAGYIFPVAGLSKSNISKLVYPSYSGHTGVDVNINVTGKSVVAVKSGTVIVSTALKNSNGTYRSYGEYVVINHGDGTMTLYAHMLEGSRTVTAGQTVSQGQKLGIVGSTGNSTGTHLHFEVRTAANSYKPVNPIPYLP